jgi:hypothetical protein
MISAAEKRTASWRDRGTSTEDGEISAALLPGSLRDRAAPPSVDDVAADCLQPSGADGAFPAHAARSRVSTPSRVTGRGLA